MVETLDHFKRYPQLVWTLLNIYFHMKEEKYDCPFLICGETGVGKTDFQLHVVELWYRVVLQQEFNEGHIRYIKNTRKAWVKNFKLINMYDINSNDEGADGITSKEGMTRFGKDLQKLYNVFRKKLFLTPILLPDYFELPLYFRKRIRGCIFIPKRGQFKYYTKENLKWINALNENQDFKKMEVTKSFFAGTFPKYEGVLRKPYDDMSQLSSDTILDEMIRDLDAKDFNVVEEHKEEVTMMLERGDKLKDVASEIGMSLRDVSRINKIYKLEKYKKEKENRNI